MRDSQHPVPGRPRLGQVIGELLLTAGVLILLFVVYEAFWTNITSGRLQDEVNAQLEESWGKDKDQVAAGNPVAPPAPVLGEGFARVYLPTLGADAVSAVVEGTRNEDLRAAPATTPNRRCPAKQEISRSPGIASDSAQSSNTWIDSMRAMPSSWRPSSSG
ncbi:hypothetical protein GCM10020255_092190 [Rhodococcus baikonurensis]